ncbi:MAG: penicillin-binding transpeptidase domain-containing protein [Burkholderiales bacterium]
MPRTDGRLVAEIRRLRTLYPNLGKEKLHVLLAPWCAKQGIALPSVSTIGRIISRAHDKMRHAPARLDARGRVKPVRRHPKPRKPKGATTAPLACLAVDTIERVRDGIRRYILTFIDPASRFRQKWFVGDTVSVGIGQGYMLATPLQLAVATATLANGGREMRPRLVRAIQNAKTGAVTPVEPETVSQLPVNPENLERVKAAMVDVTRPGGTAARAGAGAPYTMAGKTGTAQVIGIKQGEKYIESRVAERHRDHALFIAFAPAEDPRIAVAVLVENGGHGGSTAAPIARALFDYYLLGKRPAGAAATEEGAQENGDD